MIEINRSKRWKIAAPLTPEADLSLHGYPPILRQIFFNRGLADLKDAQLFIEGGKPPDTAPLRLSGVQAAVDRLIFGIRNKEKIAIYGDYDVDGVTATALLSSYLAKFDADVIEHIPNRFEDGYGLRIEALNSLKECGVDLVITVDCGIRSNREAIHAKKIGIDLIITDHHHPGDILPQAVAVIDPKKTGDEYPSKELAGVGVAFKLIEALNENLKKDSSVLSNYLDLVALGTVADIVPLIGENRYFVKKGLDHIRKPRRQGILSLIGVAGLIPENVSSTDIGFILGPRLNAAGRLTSAQAALDLLLTNDLSEAAYIAQQLEIQNQTRQRKTREMHDHAEELAFEKDPHPYLLIAINKNYNLGIVGLVASRLSEKHYLPSIVGQSEGEYTRASCRSIKEFHITKALDQCSDLLTHHGGHAAAAGFTVKSIYLPELLNRLQKIAEDQLSEIDLIPTINADIEIKLSQLSYDLLEHINWLQPTGYGNPDPLFVTRGLQVKSARTVGKDNTHLKLSVTDGWLTFDAIAFRQGFWQGQLPEYIDVAYNFEVNEFRGVKSLQLNIKDIITSS